MEDTAMRKLMLAIAAVLACAVFPASAQDGPSAPPAEPPHDTQVAPSAPSIAKPPNVEKVPNVPNVPGATENMPPGPPNRFAFNRVDDGFLRLDHQTGQVAFCSPHAIGWACQAVLEARAAQEKEIARLQDEVASLKPEIAALRAPPLPPRLPGDLAPPSTEQSEESARLRERPRARPRGVRKCLAAAGRDDRQFSEVHDAQRVAVLDLPLKGGART
jgi:cell division protein FtsB